MRKPLSDTVRRDILAILAAFSPENPVIVPSRLYRELEEAGLPMENVVERKPLPTEFT